MTPAKMATPIPNQAGIPVYQSQYGYYPCSYPGFKTLKLYHKLTRQAMKQALTHHRWARKDPRNRHRPEPEISAIQAGLGLTDLGMKGFYQDILRYYQACRRPHDHPDTVTRIASANDWACIIS